MFQLKANSKHILVVVVAFFAFQLFLLLKSPFALYELFLGFIEAFKVYNVFFVSMLASSELIGEVGLIFRFAGACFALLFAWLLFRKNKFSLIHLRKAVLFEGLNFFFLLPFITTFFVTPGAPTMAIEAGLSYTLQLILVSSTFLVFYIKLKNPSLNAAQLYRWGAIAMVSFIFALWIKHFFMNLYALPVNLSDPILLAGLLNSTLTILVAGTTLLFAFLPIIKMKQTSFNSKAVGMAFLLIGIYFLIFVGISLLNQRYLSSLGLTDLWAIAFLVPGLSLIRESKK